MFKTPQNIGISIVSFFLILFLTVSCNKAKTEDLTAAMALADTGPIYGDSCELAPTQNVTMKVYDIPYSYLNVSNVPQNTYIKIKTTSLVNGAISALSQISSSGTWEVNSHDFNTSVDGLPFASYASSGSIENYMFSSGDFIYSCYHCSTGPCSATIMITGWSP